LKSELYFIQGAGDSAAEIRSVDWTRTPLGSPEQWSAQLKTAVQMMLASRFPKSLVWGPELTTLYNDAFRVILGNKSDCMGKPFSQVWPEAWTDIGPIVDKAYGGEATFVEDFPLVINRFGFVEQCYFTFCYSPILESDGRVGGMINTVMEVTGKVEAEKSAAILNAELAHRIKNTFSVVQAIATQTFRTAVDSEDLRIFANRLHALASAHDVLRMGRNSSGTMEQIIDGILTPLGVRERVLTNGQPIRIGPKGALSTSLLMHELTTNAIKYGALSNAGGQISINWFVEYRGEERTLVMTWQEAGGPPVAAPGKEGFGSKLIEMGLLGTGNVATIYDPAGFRAEMSAPLDQIQDDGRLYSSG
jgi:two-component sensor histidine kinase